MIEKFWIEVLFSVVFILSILTKNRPMAIATALILLLKLLKADRPLEFIAKNGISWGIILITLGFLAPIVLGRYTVQDIKTVFLKPDGIIGFFAGISVALFGAKGIEIGPINSNLTLGVIVGTFVAVAFLRGTPVGPLIGSGIGFMFLTLLSKLGLI
ncbi:DUF441 domain-containing protein [Anaerobranca gottschalkii]|uniref:UPF0756 membrane protein SAMN03080614_103011 n=1 Tax=Anaerobranca gottschalkii DSM 13577 TaxID=1120990 RepID=A0A1I0B3I0_9FIRM|nr:DUF441 family protein [Anaerobranca gottschalkii]SET00508.1 Uncharacterized membrane protein, DUF441 family [Anaerobranca gottschalkii DSM 13577]